MDNTTNENNNLQVTEENNALSSVQSNIDDEINNLVERLYSGSTQSVEEDIKRLNYLQRIKSSLRLARVGDRYDDVLRVVIDRFDNEYPSFTNKELLDYAVQLQGIMENTRRAANDDIATMPILTQNNTQINIDTNTLDRASKERVVDVVKAILEDAKKGNN